MVSNVTKYFIVGAVVFMCVYIFLSGRCCTAKDISLCSDVRICTVTGFIVNQYYYEIHRVND